MSRTPSEIALDLLDNDNLTDDQREVLVDARKMLVPYSVVFEPTSLQMYLTAKHGKRERAEERAAVVAEREERAATPKVERVERPQDVVTIGQIADDLKIKASKAREALRALKFVKPEFGWAFASADVANVKEKITCYLNSSKASDCQHDKSSTNSTSKRASAKKSNASAPTSNATAAPSPTPSKKSKRTTKSKETTTSSTTPRNPSAKRSSKKRK